MRRRCQWRAAWPAADWRPRPADSTGGSAHRRDAAGGVASAFLGAAGGVGASLAAIVQMHRLLVADRDAAQILRRVFGPAHDVRNQRDHQFLALPVDALAGEQSAEDRDAGQSRERRSWSWSPGIW